MTTDYECHSPLSGTHPHSVLSPSSAGGPFNDLFDNTPLPSFARLSPNFSLHHRSFPSQSQRRRRMVTAPPTFGPNCLRLPGDGRAGGRDADGGRFLFSPPLPDRPTDRTTDRRCRHRHCLRRRRRGRRGTCEQCCLCERDPTQVTTEARVGVGVGAPSPSVPSRGFRDTEQRASERAGRGYSLAYSLSHTRTDGGARKGRARGGALPSQVRAGEPTSRTRAQWRRAGQRRRRRRRLVCERRVGGEEGGGGGEGGGEPGSLDTSAKRNVHSMPPAPPPANAIGRPRPTLQRAVGLDLGTR